VKLKFCIGVQEEGMGGGRICHHIGMDVGGPDGTRSFFWAYYYCKYP